MSYGQFCPVAKAMELLDERWTMLIVRELLTGSSRFNELRRGVPRMSPTLLSKRLNELARAGVVEKRVVDGQTSYDLTPAGQELRTVVEAVGTWGIRWMGEIGDADLDPKLLMWDIHRNIRHDVVPRGRTVIEFAFSDCPAPLRHWWLVLTPEDADICDTDPGYPVALTMSTTLRDLTRLWRGDLTWAQASRADAVSLAGNSRLRRDFPRWLALSDFAAVPRPASAAAAGLSSSAAVDKPAPPR